MTRTRSIAVKDGHFNATILDVPFSVDLAANGGFSVSGVRQTDHATVTGTGKIAGQTMELEYNHAWCEMHAILTAGGGSHIATPPAASVPQASAPVPAPTPVPTTTLNPTPSPVPVPAESPRPLPVPIPAATPAPSMPASTSMACQKFSNLCP